MGVDIRQSCNCERGTVTAGGGTQSPFFGCHCHCLQDLDTYYWQYSTCSLSGSSRDLQTMRWCDGTIGDRLAGPHLQRRQ